MATKKKQGVVRKVSAKVKSKAKSAVRKVAAKATRSLDRAAIRAAQAPAKKTTQASAAKSSASKASAAKSSTAKSSASKASAAKPSTAKSSASKAAAPKASAPKSSTAKSPASKAAAVKSSLPAPKVASEPKASIAKPSSMTKAPAVTAAIQRAAAVKSAPATSSAQPATNSAPAQKSLFASEPAPAPAVTVGQTAPAISLPGDDGKTHSLSEHLGKPVVIYFYPKDNTPGCTQQACDFRDNLARAQGKGAVVYGISRDSLASHEKFRSKFQLNFPLLSDQSLEAHRAYGTWGAKSLYGRQFDGTIRSTFLIDRQGKIARVWPKVSVTGHVDEVVSAIEALA